jgi:uncharacterized membrane protein required for colicin V production
MAYIADIVVIVLVLIFTLGGARKGFVAFLFGLVTTIIAFVLAMTLADNLVDWTNGLFGLEGKFEKGLTKKLSTIKGFGVDISATGIKEAIQGVSLPDFIADSIVAEVGVEGVAAGTTLAMMAGDTIASFISALIAGAVVFFLAKVLLGLVCRVLSGVVSRIPLIGGVNRLLGAVAGFLKGGLIVCGVLAVLSVLPSSGITAFFDKTLFVGALYHNNPILSLIGWLLA